MTSTMLLTKSIIVKSVLKTIGICQILRYSEIHIYIYIYLDILDELVITRFVLI